MYAVRIVAEDALPPEYSWALTRDGRLCALFIKQSALKGDVLAEVWAAAEATKLLGSDRCASEASASGF